MKTHLNTFNPYVNASAISIEAIHLRVSRGFKTAAMVLGFVAVMFGLSMPFSIGGVGAWLYLGVMMALFFRDQGRAVHTVRKQKDGLFMLESAHHTWNNMQLLAESVSLPFVCVLYFKPKIGSRAQKAVIWADSVPPDVFRRLRGYLRWCAVCTE